MKHLLIKVKNKLKYELKKRLPSVFRHLPIKKNKLVFDNFLGRGYGDNPKYIAEEIIRQGLDWDLVWVVNDINEKFPKGIRAVKYGSTRAMYEFATAKVWIDNVRNTVRPRKREKQFYIQTWHSSLGFKAVEAAAVVLDETYKKQAVLDGKQTDLMFANNRIRKKQFETDFWYDGEIKSCGVPRNAILFEDNKAIIEGIRRKAGIAADKKIVLYAPTFRKSKDDISVYLFDYEEISKTLSEKFGGDYQFLLRLHPNIAYNSEKFNYNDNVINASGYMDIQELLLIADVLITDYSSCMFDFSFTYKPVFLLAKDLCDYMSNDQGFILNIKQLPFKINETIEDLRKDINDFSLDAYQSKCKSFFEEIELKEDGNGAKEIVEIIKEKIK